MYLFMRYVIFSNTVCCQNTHIVIFQCYGMSEATGAHTMGNPETFDLYSVGKVVPGVKTKLANLDEEQNGEVIIYSSTIINTITIIYSAFCLDLYVWQTCIYGVPE